MEFSIKEWRTMYDKVHELSRKLSDSRPTVTETKRVLAAKIHLTVEEQKQLEAEISHLMMCSDRYLDSFGLKMPKPKWYYDRKNEETWASSTEFKYWNLIDHEVLKGMCV